MVERHYLVRNGLRVPAVLGPGDIEALLEDQDNEHKAALVGIEPMPQPDPGPSHQGPQTPP